MRKRVINFLLSAVLLAPLAACGGGETGSNSGSSSSETVENFSDESSTPTETKLWNKDPVIKSVFYDDFSNGVRSDVWQAKNETWGANNHGVSPNNVFYSTNRTKVAAAGAEGGIVALRSFGDLQQDKNLRRQGSAITSRETFGPGKYEVRMKVLPRLGQCTAAWTYYNGGGTTREDNVYSEIDIEMPMRGDYRIWSGTSYQYFVDWNILADRKTVNIDNSGALNDGQWHVYSFEWRTDEVNGDRGVVWYRDGVKYAEVREFIPEYKAALNIGNWFPDDLSWVGRPNFEEAYMYIDWVRVTQYEDPSKPGGGGGPGGGNAVNLNSQDIPVNNYIANGSFVVQSDSVLGWESINDNPFTFSAGKAKINGGKRVTQMINAQYAGYSFRLNADVTVTGAGKCKVYAEYLYGSVRMGKSSELEFDSSATGEKNIEFTITNKNVTDLRIVVETENGATATVNSLSMYM